MNDLTLEITNGKTIYRPGETLSGFVRWELASRPRELEIVLFWHTEGKGSTDTGVVDRVVREDPGERGEHDFHFVLPEAPHSFSGRLISLVWGVEALFPKEKLHVHTDFVLSPDGRDAVRLDEGREAPPQQTSPFKKLFPHSS